jgi:hypothetical protein
MHNAGMINKHKVKISQKFLSSYFILALISHIFYACLNINISVWLYSLTAGDTFNRFFLL